MLPLPGTIVTTGSSVTLTMLFLINSSGKKSIILPNRVVPFGGGFAMACNHVANGKRRIGLHYGILQFLSTMDCQPGSDDRVLADWLCPFAVARI